MSVIVTMHVNGDTEQFRRFVDSNQDILRRIATDARSQGCLHHRFGVGDGFVQVVDEWESAEKFQSFFQNNPDIPGVMRDAGAQGEPQFTFAEAISTADEF
ncbi:MAG: hypothetical protein ACTHNU_16675 [Gaiellales bacterium]